MKLHSSVIEKLIYLWDNYGGHSDYTKLQEKLKELDFTPYEKKTGNQEIILVLTDDYLQSLKAGEKK